MATAKKRYELEFKYSEIECRAIAYLSTKPFAITSDCHHALHNHLANLASDRIKDSRTLSIVTWGTLEAIMKIVADEVGSGSERAWMLKSAEELSLFPEQIIRIYKEYGENE